MWHIPFRKVIRAFAVTCLVGLAGKVSAQQKDWIVRMAKIEIDSAYLDAYKAALSEHTAAALKAEPGVLTLYSASEKAHPTKFVVFEIYASKEAYEAHLKTAHFLHYKSSTLKMVKSLELVELDPVALGAQPGLLEMLKR